MKAKAWFGNRDIHLIELDVPDITEPDNVIKVADITICGSDLHIYHGEVMALQKFQRR
jgi:threonine dehydrogenase-like Zn-dependent dehydrogenase